jgi:uncharacterized protein YndB with AHSA1/START domain
MMSTGLPPDLPPVRHRIVVPLAPDDAFALFTAGIARWWPFNSHSCSGDAALDVEFEARVGGAVTEVARDGDRHSWGTLTAWEPPHRLAMTWHPAQTAAHATLLTVRFGAVEGGCAITIEHGGWSARGDTADADRKAYEQGWVFVLGRYADAAREGWKV